MPRSHRGTTTQAGYGSDHVRTRARLLRQHIDGTPCPCTCQAGTRCPCRRAGYPLPMYRTAEHNVDRRALQADHSTPRVLGGERADRLVIATCNLSMGATLGNQLRGRRRRVELPVW